MITAPIRSFAAVPFDRRAASRKIKDVLEESIIYRISSNDFLRDTLVIVGGAALHFAYSSPRYTNDIDFGADLVGNKKKIMIELANLLPELDGNPVKFSVKKELDFFIRVSYIMELGNGFTPGVSLEGGHTPPLMGTVDYQTPFGYVRMESPAEIMADKILASMQRLEERGSIKGTDVFDFFFITQTHQVEIPHEILLKKAVYYSFPLGISDVAGRIKQVMKKIEATKETVIKNISRQLTEAYASNFDFQKMLEGALAFLDRVAGKSPA